MDNESREETVESLRAILIARQERVDELLSALPEVPKGGFTDEEADKYLSINRQIIQELEEMENIHHRIEALWLNTSASTTPFATAIRQVVSSRADARSAQLEEWFAEQREQESKLEAAPTPTNRKDSTDARERNEG